MLDSRESKFILQKLSDELAPHLHYHSVNHTLDVYQTAVKLAAREKISAADTRLLLVAALYHDSGFLYQSDGHEARSCRIASEVLPGFGYVQTEIDQICRMIAATKIPQNPQSKLEEIICDADLDYLGRDDFFEIGNGLYLELLSEGIIANETEWNHMQIKFLQQHRFFTKTAQRLRNDKKSEHLKILLSKTQD